MNAKELLCAIGLLDDELVLEAERPQRLRVIRWQRWGLAAACAVLVILLLPKPAMGGNSAGQASDLQQMAGGGPAAADAVQSDLEPVTLGWTMADFGFEGIVVRTAEELDGGCPWTGEELAELPVYRNQNEVLIEGACRFGLNAQEMEQQLRQLAGVLGYTVGEVAISPSEEQVQHYRERLEEQGRDPDTDPNYEINVRPVSARASAEGTEFSMSTTGEFTMNLAQPLVLPEAYRLTQQSDGEDAAGTALYLAEQYAKALEIADPQPQVRVEYSNTGEKMLTLRVRNGGELVEQLLDYSFGGVQFYLDETGSSCTGLRVLGRQAVGELMGQYPLITVDEAEQALVEGRCYTSVTETFPGIDHLGQVELVYREGSETVVPYYRFWVELPDLETESGLRTFGVYYVPAIEPDYLTDPPVAQWEMDG